MGSSYYLIETIIQKRKTHVNKRNAPNRNGQAHL